jgi:hypothetical protein
MESKGENCEPGIREASGSEHAVRQKSPRLAETTDDMAQPHGGFKAIEVFPPRIFRPEAQKIYNRDNKPNK